MVWSRGVDHDAGDLVEVGSGGGERSPGSPRSRATSASPRASRDSAERLRGPIAGVTWREVDRQGVAGLPGEDGRRASGVAGCAEGEADEAGVLVQVADQVEQDFFASEVGGRFVKPGAVAGGSKGRAQS